jgi:hypothetical protein
VLTTFHNKLEPPETTPLNNNSVAYFIMTTKKLQFHNSFPGINSITTQLFIQKTITAKMATPKHTIHPVEKSDLPTLATLVGASKLALTINRLLFKDWPNEVAQKPLYTGAVEGGFADPSVTNLKAVDNETGEIVGYLGLTRKRPAVTATEKKKEEEKAPGDLPSQVPFGIVPEVLKEVVRAIGEVESGNVFAGKDCYGMPSISHPP